MVVDQQRLAVTVYFTKNMDFLKRGKDKESNNVAQKP
jgi:hypothetical protein